MAPKRTRNHSLVQFPSYLPLYDVISKLSVRLMPDEVKNLKDFFSSSINQSIPLEITTLNDIWTFLHEVGRYLDENVNLFAEGLKIIERYDLFPILKPSFFKDRENSANLRKRSPSPFLADQLSGSGKKSRTSEPNCSTVCEVPLTITLTLDDYQGFLSRGVRVPPEMAQRGDMTSKLYMFSAATTYLSMCDMGRMVCRLSFSNLSSLDKLWDDYLSGELASSLRGEFGSPAPRTSSNSSSPVVIITEALREKVNHQDIKLYIYIKEQDYLKGRQILLNEAERRDED